MKISFLGGAGTVTGSKILVEYDYKKILIDCGLFQGLNELRSKNWDELPIELNDLNYVFLTHAHLDHCGHLPSLVKNGYENEVFCTEPTRDLAKIILLDSGKIHEEDAKRANKYSYTKHKIAKPLYTIADAVETISRLKSFDYEKWHIIDDTLKFKFVNSGHILGSAFVILNIKGKIFVFSGDLGRENPIILNKYKYIEKADYLIVESTYGNRLHKNSDVIDNLLKCINHTYSKGGILAIPTFSVERAQEIIYLLSVLNREKKLPKIPIYLDSPMGVSATNVYFSHIGEHKLSEDDINSMMKTVQLVSNVHTSRTVVKNTEPKIVLAGSGMLTGGRILHYLDKIIKDEKNTILIVGFQAEGTRGRGLIMGEKEIKFFGKYYKVRAEVFKINEFSGHADQDEIMDWLEHFESPPKLTFINHGEPHQSQALRTKIISTLNWKCTVAKMNEIYHLD